MRPISEIVSIKGKEATVAEGYKVSDGSQLIFRYVADEYGIIQASVDDHNKTVQLHNGIKKVESWVKGPITESPLLPEIPEGTRCRRMGKSDSLTQDAKVVVRDGQVLGVWGTDTFWYRHDLPTVKRVRFTKGDKWIEVRSDGVVTVSKTLGVSFGYTKNGERDNPAPLDLGSVRIEGGNLIESRAILYYIDSGHAFQNVYSCTRFLQEK